MFFSSLNAQLRGRITTVGVAITIKPDNLLSVMVTPIVSAEMAEKAPHLAAPFVLTGTPEDLDAGFAQQFAALATQHGSMAQQVTDQLAALKAASEAKAAEAKANAAKKVAGKPGTSKAGAPASEQLANVLAGDDDDGNDNDDDSPATPTSSPVLPASVTTPVSADELF